MPEIDISRRRKLELLAALTAAVAGTPMAAHANPPACQPWSSTIAYTQGGVVIDKGATYTANWWTQGEEPVTHNGGAGSGQPWTKTGSCGTPPPPPPGATFMSPYKDVTVSMNWNTNVISTAVTGTLTPVLSAEPSKNRAITWAFATGQCGSENWGGIQPAALVAANVQNFVNAGKKYVISTGGAAGVFTCASDSGFETFVNRYASSSLAGIDFDIEGGQSQADVDNLVQRVKTSQPKHPGLRWSFTIATLGGNAPQSLGSMGAMVMASIKSHGLSNYLVNLMTMDYGSAIASNCTLNSSGKCDMGKSATQAAVNLHNYYGTPYSQIEITPMIGGNDATDETFTIADVTTVTNFVAANKLSGIHFWSMDRDKDCAPGFASPTCNSYGQAGTWGFTNKFISNLGW